MSPACKDGVTLLLQMYLDINVADTELLLDIEVLILQNALLANGFTCTSCKRDVHDTLRLRTSPCRRWVQIQRTSMKLETSVTVGVSDDLKHETGCTGNDRNVGTSKTPNAACV